MNGISISDLRDVARRAPEWADLYLDLIAAAEALNARHKLDCGCSDPGGPDCVWPQPEGRLLQNFDFDEEVIRL